MKNRYCILLAAVVVVLMTGCDAFRTLSESRRVAALGSPNELIVVCSQQGWDGALGDSLRVLLTAPVPYLNQTEPLFDVLRVTERGFVDLVVKHRNILKVIVDPSLEKTVAGVEYDVSSAPQVVMTLQGPTDKAIIDYLSVNGGSVVRIFEQAERDRALDYASRFNEGHIQQVIEQTFGIRMSVPKGYVLAAEQPDFVWARYEYPEASQGFFLYSYPYLGKESLSEASLLAARNKFAARIPGPAAGSYMTTSDAFTPDFRMFRLEGRLWVEMRGFWDVKGDFMGGPFVSYSTIDTATNRVFTLDGYVYSPKNHKRNYLRGVEHLLYMIQIP